jgi:ribosomal protein L37AE/L43A
MRKGQVEHNPGPQCAVLSDHGNCPRLVAWAVNINDNEMWLCDRCYQNVKDGVYGHIPILAAIPIPTHE